MNKIYLDNAATTAPAKEVVDAMMPYYIDFYGNPGSLHDIGSEARAAVDRSRETVAEFMGCDPDHVIFTSGGSEANNIIVSGFSRDGERLYTAVEHPSIIESMQKKRHGYAYAWPMLADGTINTIGLSDELLKNKVVFMAAMYVNNEIGTVNNIAYLSDLCKESGTWLHTDCVQAAGSIRLNAQSLGVDSMSISSHKIHGPKGVGALYVRDFSQIEPFIYGGQEHGIRGGTENVPGVVGFAKACELYLNDFEKITERIKSNKMRMINVLAFLAKKNNIENLLHFNAKENNDSKIVNFRIDGVDSQTLLMMMNAMGVYASAGSACKSRLMRPSHVLKAIGLSDEEAYSSIRLSFSRYNTSEDVDEAAEIIINCAVKLLELAKKG